VGASIKFIASKFIGSGVPVGSSLELITDSAGAYSEDILESSYHIFYKQAGHELYTHLSDAHLYAGMGGVAIGDPITLGDIIGAGITGGPAFTGCASIPAPTAFTATSGFTSIILSWAGTGYTCHDVTEIWTSATSDFSTKVLLTTVESEIYTHSLGADGSRHYWIRFRNLNKDYGNWFSTTSVAGTTSTDPGKVLDDLQVDIYNSSLFAALRSNFSATFAQDIAPTVRLNGDALKHGDLWIDTNDSNQQYIYDASLVPPAWSIKVNKETSQLLTDVTHAQTTADDGTKGFFQPTAPLAAESNFNDIWIDTSYSTPLTTLAIKRYENSSGGSTGTLSWRNAPTNAVGKTYMEAYNNKALINDQAVTLQEHFTSINGLEGKYSLRINANGTIAGFGLAAGTGGCLVSGVLDESISETSCTGTGKVWVPPTSSFIVNANTFAVTGSNAAGATIPFVVDAGTGEVGVQGSLIVDGTITADELKTDAVTATKIKAGEVTASHMNATSVHALTVQSTNYVAGVQGWKIDRAGTIDASHGNFRGSVTGATGTFSGSLNVNSGGTSRMEIVDNVIKVYDGGTLRVKLGYLG